MLYRYFAKLKGLVMGDVDLDDVRGYWRELASPAALEFWHAHQEDVAPSREQLRLVYLRLLSAAILLNHQSDKAAGHHGLERGNQFIGLVKQKDQDIAAKMDACRNFVNDAKLVMKGFQTSSFRPRQAGYDHAGTHDVIVLTAQAKDGKLYDQCRVVIDVWQFWVGYFNGSAAVTFREGLDQVLAENPP